MFLIVAWILLALIIYVLWLELISYKVYWPYLKMNDRHIKRIIKNCDLRFWNVIMNKSTTYHIGKVDWIFTKYYIDLKDWNKNWDLYQIPVKYNKLIEEKFISITEKELCL